MINQEYKQMKALLNQQHHRLWHLHRKWHGVLFGVEFDLRGVTNVYRSNYFSSCYSQLYT